MRILFLGMEGRLTTRPLEAVARRHELVGVVAGQRSRSFWRPDPNKGNLARFADHYGVPLHSSRSGIEAFIRRRSPDLLCVSNYPFLLPSSTLELTPAINLHPSLLPAYRGVCPWLWQFYHQETAGGWTVHQVDDGVDSGPILGQVRFEIPFGVSAGELIDNVLQDGAELMARAVAELESGAAAAVPQRGTPSRAPMVRPGTRMVEWESWPVERVYHFLHGASPWHDELTPWPGFRTRVTGFTGTPSELAPGRRGRDDRGTFVACLHGRLYYSRRPVARELSRMALVTAAATAAGVLLW